VDQANALGMARHVYFTGFIPDEALLRLYKVADVACFPSLYEPFGIVALEAMAVKTPVVVSDSGGLPEVVEADVTGTVTWANNSDSLAWGILRVLHNPLMAHEMAERAAERVQTIFNWDVIAEQTNRVYKRVQAEYVASAW
jgi:glycogen(starch) synthase